MQFDWWTFALQAVNFVVLVWLLSRFLYRPVKEIIAKREALADQAFKDADKVKQDAEAERRSLEEARAKLTAERQEMLKTIHDDLEAERSKVLEAAKREADELLETARTSIAKERRTALADLKEQVASLAVELASEILSKAGAGSPSGLFLDQLEERLRDLPEDERERLRRDLSKNGARLTVVTASPLSSDEQAQWSGRLAARLENKAGVDFLVDPAIVGGAELRFPHAALKLTWADQLRAAQDRIRSDEAAS